MQTLSKSRLYALAAAGLCALLGGCGSGDDSGPSGLTYSGATVAATLTANNSATLVGGAYSGGNSGINAGGPRTGLSNYDFGASRRPRSLVLSDALLGFVRRTAADDTLARPETAATAANIPVSILHGSCGGSATVNGSYDDGNRTLSLTANLSDYCEDQTTLNGTVGASGQAVMNAQNRIKLSQLTINLAKLTVGFRGDSFTADGAVTVVPQAGYAYIDSHRVLSIDVLFKDKATAKVFKLENFKISLAPGAGGPSHDDITISGRYYDPDMGYIDLSTPAALRIMAGDDWPSSGSLRGTGHNSSATLTALDDNAYRLDLDTDDNGAAEYTENGLWNDL